MADRPFLQLLAGEAASFFELTAEVLGYRPARAALIKDLGGDPKAARDADPFPAGPFDSIRAYRDAADPSAEAGLQMLADVGVLLDVLASQIETWSISTGAGAEETVHDLFELLASNFVRLRWPRMFILLQSIALAEELGSTFGEGNNSAVRVWSAISALFGYIFQPGKSMDRLTGPSGAIDEGARVLDLYPRVAASILGFFVKSKAEQGRTWVLKDVYTGWDAPSLDVDALETPATADLIAARMTSFVLGEEEVNLSTDPSGAGRVVITTTMVPEDLGGTGVFLALGGSSEVSQPFGTRWVFSFKFRADAAVAVLLGTHGLRVPDLGGGSFQASAGLASQPEEATGLSFSFPSAKGTRLDVGQLAFSVTLGPDGAELLVTLADAALVVDSADHDGLVSELLGKTPLRLGFGLVFGYSSSRGRVLEASFSATGKPAQPAPLGGPATSGSPVLAFTIPVGRGYGPVTVHEVALRLTRGPADAAPQDMNQQTLEIDTSFSAQIGPVYLRLDQLGLLLRVDGAKPASERNLGLVDLHLGAKAPLGVAVQVDTAYLTGGGSILHDPDQGIYFGAFDLAFNGGMVLKALALVATPDGAKGFSLLVLVTAEFNGWPLGLGFYLEGLGGLLALHRTFDETAMRAALPTGELRHVLFPSDPVHHTTEVLHALQTLFPARRGSHLFGVLAKIGWGRPKLIEFELGVIYEWGHQHRLIALGRVSALLPRRDHVVLKLNMDALGLLDFDAGTFALDAVLHDSRLCGRFVLTGAMAMRVGFAGTGGFALAVGGLHPRFTAPPGFPSVARLQLALTNGDNPKLLCQAYFAITSNTIQFGAECSLYAAAFGFSLEGDVGFEVLIQLLPFHFLADFRASVQLKRGSHNLFKVSVAGELEGPLPLRLAGKATFEILWCDFSVSFNVTLVSGELLDALVPVDVLDLLTAALGDPGAWQALLPGPVGQLVATRTAVDEAILLHPLGTLTVRQNVVPLNLTRDIDRVGSGPPLGPRRFAVTHAALGAVDQSKTAVKERFAPAQFFDMSDDDKLAAPSFEPMDAGVVFGEGGYRVGFAARETSPFHYTDILVGADGEPVTQPDPHAEDGSRVLVLTMVSPAGGAATRRTLTRRFEAPARTDAPTVHPGGWAAVAAAGPAPAATTTWAEARGQVLAANDPSQWLIVPAHELAGS
jgi:hypothetical protein